MENYSRRLTIAIDFDGTIVEHKYPEIGQPQPEAFEVLRELQEKGHRLILWTVRDGTDLEDAINFCLDNGIIFYAVNQTYPEEEFNKYISRKVDVDLFIDDRNIGGFIGWNNVRKILIPDSPKISHGEKAEKAVPEKKKRGLFSRNKKD